MAMGGYAAAGGVSRPITDPGDATTLILDNAVGFSPNDLTLVSQAGTTDCLLEQISSISGNKLTLAGTYYTAGPTSEISALAGSTTSYVTPLGNALAGNLQMQLFGAGPNNTLFSYDLLQGSGSDTRPGRGRRRGRNAHALYGLDTNGDGLLDAWADPGAIGYDIDTVMATPATMRQIIAVRVALVLRNTNYEKTAVAPSTVTWFDDAKNAANASLKQTLLISGDDLHYRYRVIDSIIPLRNMLLLP